MKIQQINVIRKIDTFKSNWYLWECVAFMEDGSEVYGFVQADHQGEAIDFSSFEKEEE